MYRTKRTTRAKCPKEGEAAGRWCGGAQLINSCRSDEAWNMARVRLPICDALHGRGGRGGRGRKERVGTCTGTYTSLGGGARAAVIGTGQASVYPA